MYHTSNRSPKLWNIGRFASNMSPSSNNPQSFVCRQLAIMLRSVRTAAFGAPSLPLVKTRVPSFAGLPENSFSPKAERISSGPRRRPFAPEAEARARDGRENFRGVENAAGPRKRRVCLRDFLPVRGRRHHAGDSGGLHAALCRHRPQRKIEVHGNRAREQAGVVCRARHERRRYGEPHPARNSRFEKHFRQSRGRCYQVGAVEIFSARRKVAQNPLFGVGAKSLEHRAGEGLFQLLAALENFKSHIDGTGFHISVYQLRRARGMSTFTRRKRGMRRAGAKKVRRTEHLRGGRVIIMHYDKHRKNTRARNNRFARESHCGNAR